MDYVQFSVFQPVGTFVQELSKYRLFCVGYELALSKRLKQASDGLVNNPRVPRGSFGVLFPNDRIDEWFGQLSTLTDGFGVCGPMAKKQFIVLL